METTNEIPSEVRERIRKEAEIWHFNAVHEPFGCCAQDGYEAGAKSEWLLSQQQWISVKERLPELDVAVLIWPRTLMAMSWMKEKDGKAKWFFDSIEITHWMPLPPPPQNK